MDEAALLAGIIAAPADDAPRLVYADWLEEHGRGVLAEMIRWHLQSRPHREVRVFEIFHETWLRRDEPSGQVMVGDAYLCEYRDGEADGFQAIADVLRAIPFDGLQALRATTDRPKSMWRVDVTRLREAGRVGQ